ATRSDRPLTAICLVSIMPRCAVPAGSVMSSLKDVGSRRGTKIWITRAAQRGRPRNLFARARLQPVAPVEPPTAFALLRRGQECVRLVRRDRPDHERRLR